MADTQLVDHPLSVKARTLSGSPVLRMREFVPRNRGRTAGDRPVRIPHPRHRAARLRLGAPRDDGHGHGGLSSTGPEGCSPARVRGKVSSSHRRQQTHRLDAVLAMFSGLPCVFKGWNAVRVTPRAECFCRSGTYLATDCAQNQPLIGPSGPLLLAAGWCPCFLMRMGFPIADGWPRDARPRGSPASGSHNGIFGSGVKATNGPDSGVR